MERVKTACEAAGAGQDILLMEGGGSLREGYIVGLPTPEVARALGSQVLAVICYQNEVQVLDDVLAAKVRLGEALCGVIINRVPSEASSFVTQIAVPYLEQRGIAVFGVFPEARGLAAVTVGEIIQVLEAEVLTKYLRSQAMIETLTVGAMTAETALSRFRLYSHKAVITGGDRTDIQLAALETSTTCLILTGNLRPSPLVVKQAEEFGVTVLLVRANTLETVEAIERIFGRTHLGLASKLKQFQLMLDKNLDFARLYRAIGLEA
jgi:BioD-like phosphotransacetylase family protein